MKYPKKMEHIDFRNRANMEPLFKDPPFAKFSLQ